MKKGAAYILLILLLSVSACSDQKVIKDQDKFAALYVDLLFSMEKNNGNDDKLKEGREKVYQQYSVTAEQYKATLDYYSEKPERWKEFFEKVNARIAVLRKKT
ncbi:MAG: DUF4296 domain-containing protein [Ignavibacteriales bacterium]